MDEQELSSASAIKVRLYEAAVFLGDFERHCGSPEARDNWLKWIAYADAFVTGLVSAEEFVSDRLRRELQQLDIFRFIKAVRNITVHESVWPAPKQRRGAKGTVSRIINIHVGGVRNAQWVEPKMSVASMRRTLSRRLRNRPAERNTVEGARRFLAYKKRTTGDDFLLIDVFRQALTDVAAICRVDLENAELA